MTINEKDIIEYYNRIQSLRATSKHFGISEQTTRRILIANGCFTSERFETITKLAEAGFTIEQICAKTKLSPSAVFAYLPYSKGSYVIGEKSENAKRIAKCRENKIEQTV